jgi:hypothetical protein
MKGERNEKLNQSIPDATFLAHGREGAGAVRRRNSCRNGRAHITRRLAGAAVPGDLLPSWLAQQWWARGAGRPPPRSGAAPPLAGCGKWWRGRVGGRWCPSIRSGSPVGWMLEVVESSCGWPVVESSVRVWPPASMDSLPNLGGRALERGRWEGRDRGPDLSVAIFVILIKGGIPKFLSEILLLLLLGIEV